MLKKLRNFKLIYRVIRIEFILIFFLILFSFIFFKYLSIYIDSKNINLNLYNRTGFDYRFGEYFEKFIFLKYLVVSLTTFSIYLFYRLFLNKWFSLLGTLVFLTSPLNIYNLTQSIGRDYIKILFITFILIFIIIFYKKHKITILNSVILGIIIGFGLLFRKDIFIFFIPVILIYSYHLFFNNNQFKFDSSIFFKIFILIIISTLIYLLSPIQPFEDLSRGSHSLISGFSNRYSIIFDMYFNNLSLLSNSEDQYLMMSTYIFGDTQEYKLDNVRGFSLSFYFALKAILIQINELFLKLLVALITALSIPFKYFSYSFLETNNTLIFFYEFICRILSILNYIFIVIFLYFQFKLNKNFLIYFLLVILFFISYPILQYQLRHFFYIQFIMSLPTFYVFEKLFSKK